MSAHDNYVLPLTEDEIARLHAQAHYLDHATDPLLHRYVRPGMHCVEFGCGLGPSTETIRTTLGRVGSLTSVDQGPAFLDYTRRRLEMTGNAGVRFVNSRAEEFALPDGLDLIFGRAVLHHTRDAAGIYARCAAALEPGGFVIFQEPVVSGIFRHALPEPVALLWRWYLALGARGGVDFDVGEKLADFALDAGLELVEMAGYEPILVSEADRSTYPSLLKVVESQLIESEIATPPEVAATLEELAALAVAGRPLPYVPFNHLVATRPLHPADPVA